MIKNIVFDMGKVLVDYDGMLVCRHFTDNEALAKKSALLFLILQNGYF